MIIVDYSAISIAAIVIAHKTKGDEVTPSYCKHMILNSVRGYNKNWKHKYGNLHICCDSDDIWRKEVFKEYKGKRQQGRDESSLDWDMIYATIDSMRINLKKNFPYHVHMVYRAEADDIIGYLARKATANREPSLIVSNDKDFQQLHSDYVEQYRPATRQITRNPDPLIYLREQIIRGDAGDGVPNIFSDDDAILNEDKRQNKVTKKRFNAIWSYPSPHDIEDERIKRNYFRNQKMIDLNFTPDHIITDIQQEVANSHPVGNQQSIMSFLAENRMRVLLGRVNEFI